MNLRNIFIILLSLAALGLSIILISISSYVIFKDISSREQEDIHKELDRAKNILNQERSTLEKTLMDWAYWDETYQFAQKSNAEYITDNLNQDSLRNINIDIIAIYNQKGENILNLQYDREFHKYTSSKELASLFSPDYYFLQNSEPLIKNNGIIILSGRPAIIVMAKILTSQQQGPVQGTLLFGRYLDQTFIQEINQAHNIRMDMIISNNNNPPKINDELKWLNNNEDIFNNSIFFTLHSATSKTNGYLAAFYPYLTLDQKNYVVIKVSKQRSILQQGLVSLRIILLSIIVTAIIFILLTYFSFNRLIISRILAIGTLINEISTKNDIHLRIPVQGHDEITSLSQFINNMLDNLEIAQRELSESELRFRSFVTHSYDGIIILNEQGKIVLWNKSMEKLFSTPADQVMGKLLIEVLWNYSPLKNTLGDLTFHRFKRRISAYFKAIQRKRHIKNVELQLMSNKTNKMYIELTAFPITTFERPLFGIILRNITHRKNLEEKLNYLSTHDSLTKLYNRYFFDTEMERFQDSRLFPISIILFDIDNLKITNDTYGHSFGDKILVNFSNILLQSFRSEDIIARIGGDEFAVLLPRTNENSARKILERVYANLNEYNQNISNIPLHMSAGLVCVEKGESLKEMLIQADLLMYQEKTKKSTQSF